MSKPQVTITGQVHSLWISVWFFSHCLVVKKAHGEEMSRLENFEILWLLLLLLFSVSGSIRWGISFGQASFCVIPFLVSTTPLDLRSNIELSS